MRTLIFILLIPSLALAQTSVDSQLIKDAFSSGNTRILALGDSFAAPIKTRVLPAGLIRNWTYPAFTAVAGGTSRTSNIVQGLSFVESNLVQSGNY